MMTMLEKLERDRDALLEVIASYERLIATATDDHEILCLHLLWHRTRLCELNEEVWERRSEVEEISTISHDLASGLIAA